MLKQFPPHIPRDGTFYILGAMFYILIVPIYFKGDWGGLCLIYRDYNLPVILKITDCIAFLISKNQDFAKRTPHSQD